MDNARQNYCFLGPLRTFEAAIAALAALSDANSRIAGINSCDSVHFVQRRERGFQNSGKVFLNLLNIHQKNEPPTSLLLVDHARPAELVRLEADSHLDAIGDLNKGNTFVHPIVLAIEGQCPFDFA
jgi:hypothetical protein